VIKERNRSLSEPPIVPLGTEATPPSKQLSKRRIDAKTTAIILLVIVLIPIIAGLAIKYIDLDKRYNTLTSNYRALNNSYSALQNEHEDLKTSYQTLNTSYKTLNQKYTTLDDKYATLNDRYTNLNNIYANINSSYATLSSQYATLFQDYNELSQAFNEPLAYETTPTTTQLQDWLTSDSTNSIGYTTPNFICGDFSVMLSQHAKLTNWDIGIVAVWGYTETIESYAHAFNAVITTEGLVYIEPQNDNYWWYTGHQEISPELWWEINNQWIYVEDYSVIVWYS
jgi:chaperonin cofactor prefoldin